MLMIAGTLLVCWVKISDPGTYGSFVKDVPTKVLHIDQESGDVLVEYDFNKAPGIDYIGDKPIKALVNQKDLESTTYGRCKYAGKVK